MKLVDAAIAKNNEDRVRTEEERGESVKEIGNMLHESCIISNDEVIIRNWCAGLLILHSWPISNQPNADKLLK